MNKKLVISFFLFGALFFTDKVFAQTEILNVPSELIIEVTEATPNRNLESIELALNNLGGVTIVAFCNSQKCFYLTIDRKIQPDDQLIINTILGLGYTPQVKTEATIERAQAECKDRE